MAKVVRDWCAVHVRGRASEVIFRQLKFYAVVGIGSTVIGLAIIVALHKGAGFGLFAANAIGYGAGSCSVSSQTAVGHSLILAQLRAQCFFLRASHSWHFLQIIMSL